MSSVNLWRELTFKKSTTTWGTLTRLKTNLFKNGGDRKAEWGRAIPINIKECIGWARRGSMTVEKWFDETGRMEMSRKQNENDVKSRKVEDGIGNVETKGERLRSLDIASWRSAEGAGRSRDVDYRRRHRRRRREARRPLNASISDRDTERWYWQYRENGSENASEKWRNIWTNWLIFEMWVLNHWECKNNNNIGILILTKVDGYSLIWATSYYHILVIPHQPTNELVR
jgi:hypothetical protein